MRERRKKEEQDSIPELLWTSTNKTAGKLIFNTLTAKPEQTNDEILQLFAECPDVVAMPVVENDRPLGLINRNLFMDRMARPFHKEIYGRKSCIVFMDREPLIVEGNTSIPELSFLAVEAGDKTLQDGFIVTENARYAGMGKSQDLLRAIADLQAEKNRLVMESISYASVIQKSFSRPFREEMSKTLADFFLRWEPRDVVGGDYYFFTPFEDGFFIGVIDCTGHGVPGAFMTLIVTSFLNQALLRETRNDPAAVLYTVNRMVKSALGQKFHVAADGAAGDDDAADDFSDDGMDSAFCWVDTVNGTLTYAGARLPVFILPPEDAPIVSLNGDRKGVGYVSTPFDYEWTNKTIDWQPGTRVYIATDGIIDQIGGQRGISFGKARLREIIERTRQLPMREQEWAIMEAFCQYQGEQRRRDDVTILGFRL